MFAVFIILLGVNLATIIIIVSFAAASLFFVGLPSAVVTRLLPGVTMFDKK